MSEGLEPAAATGRGARTGGVRAQAITAGRGVMRQVWRTRSGRWGLVLCAVVAGIGASGPLVAGSAPIVCSYEGRLYFPAVREWVRSWPGLGRLVGPGVFEREAVRAAELGWGAWPMIPYGPKETSEEGLAGPSGRHWLGTDHLGRDVASRLVHGTGIAVRVAAGSMAIAIALGVVLGGLGGALGGWVDALIGRVIEAVLCFPVVVVVLAVAAWIPPRVENVIVLIGLTRWASIARYVRAECLRVREAGYVEAAKVVGAPRWWIIWRHILPNALGPVYVAGAFGAANAILIEAGLSWLGLGVAPGEPSWGSLLRTAYEHIRLAPHLVWPPCAAVFVAVMGFQMLGEGFQAALDPRRVGPEGVPRGPGG